MEIKAIYDNPKFIDRYTIEFDDDSFLTVAKNPDMFSQWGSDCLHNSDKKIKFYELPVDVQRHIVVRMSEGE